MLVGSLGPLGFFPASGTVTVAVVGVPLFYAMHDWRWFAYLPVVFGLTAASVWLHQVGDRILGEKDSRRLVWDEVVGFLFAVAFVPFTWQTAVTAVCLERVIDIAKVPPARQIERHWPGGWGVVGDDVIAGLFTCGIMQVLCRTAPHLMGVGG